MRTSLFSSLKHSSPARSEDNSTSSSYSSPHRARNTFSDQIMAENIENSEAIITRLEFQGGATNKKFSSLFREFPTEAKKLLKAIQELQQTMHYLIKHDSTSEPLIRAQNLMEIAIRRLEKEFHFILSRNRNILDLESISNRSSSVSSARTSVSDDVESIENVGETEEEEDKVSNESIMDDLKTIAECMIASGYGKECINIYKLVRKSIIDESLYNIGVIERSMNPSQIQKLDWNTIEFKIKNWLRGIKIAMKDIFLEERILCDYVFASSEKVIESCFVEIAKGRALALLSFPEIIAKYKKLSAEKMFRILDMYEAISSLQTEIDVIFAFDSSSIVRSQAVKTLVRLGEVVRSMWSEFESSIQKDASKAVPGGGLHPLTRYVINYLVFIADYSVSLEDILADWPLEVKSVMPEGYFPARSDDGENGSQESAFPQRVAWLVFLVLCKLDAKAELYKDVVLAYLFLANNLNYIVAKIRKSNLGPIVGSEWIFKNEVKLKQYTSNYERIGWSKVMTAFPEHPTNEMTQEFVMQCFINFNSGFEDAYRRQSSWVIPDQKLKEQVKLSLARKIIPGYREFYGKYRSTWRSKFGKEATIRFTPEDLENYLSDLFHGVGGFPTATAAPH